MKAASERAVLLVIGAVQFINILDFMMVMPMGPDFSRALDIPLSHLGYIGGSYTAAAAVSGLAGSFFLDRFDRKRALLVALVGLVVGTALGGIATGFVSLIVARMVAGAFGGPATSLAMSMVADLVPPERRGRAVGAVMGAFSVASVVGVPVGLYLALVGGWRMPFLVVAAAGAVIAVFAARLLPSFKGHIARAGQKQTSLRELASRRTVQLSWLMTAVVMTAGFAVIPNLSSYLQENLGYPRDRLGLLYMVGGVASYAMMRAGGWMTDKLGSFAAGTLASAFIATVMYFGFVHFIPGTPVMVLFVSFMAALALRNVAYNTLTSKVPSAQERARFMSIQSSVQHLASATGAFVAARLLVENPDGSLGRMDTVAFLSIGLTALLPIMLRVVERGVRRPDVKARTGMQPHELQSGVTSAGPGMPRPPPRAE